MACLWKIGSVQFHEKRNKIHIGCFLCSQKSWYRFANPMFASYFSNCHWWSTFTSRKRRLETRYYGSIWSHYWTPCYVCQYCFWICSTYQRSTCCRLVIDFFFLLHYCLNFRNYCNLNFEGNSYSILSSTHNYYSMNFFLPFLALHFIFHLLQVNGKKICWCIKMLMLIWKYWFKVFYPVLPLHWKMLH